MGYIWLVCSLALIAVFLILPVRLRVQFAYSKNADKKRLCIWVCGLRVLKNDFDGKKEKNDEKQPQINQTGNGPEFESFMDKLRYYESLLDALKADAVRALVYLKNKLCILKFVMHLDLGFADAAHTGIASGAAYGLVYGVAALVYNNLNLKKKDLDVCVTPHYDNPKTDFYFDGIIRLRMVHIISMLIMVLNLYGKYKKLK